MAIANTSRLSIEIGVAENGAVTAIRRVGDEAENTGRRGRAGFENAGGGVDKFSNQVRGSARDLELMSGIVGKLAGLLGAWKLGEMVKDTALLAARYETLGVVMGVVGNNAGYTSVKMNEYEASLRKTGIAAIESRTVLTRMAQAHLDLAQTSKLARVAQDAAVIGNINSSEAFERMVTGIKAGEVEILRNIGLNVNFEQSYRVLEAQLGRHKGALNEAEKTQARMNSVLQAGTGIAGAYEASMGTAGKQILSMQRYIDDLKVKAGASFQDVLVIGVQTLTSGLKDANKELDDLAENGKIEAWARGLVRSISPAADILQRIVQAAMAAGAIAGNISVGAELKAANQYTPEAAARNRAQLDEALASIYNTPTYSQQADKVYADRDANKPYEEAMKRVAEAVRMKAAAVRAATAATEADTAATQKAADEHKKYLEKITDQYLPLKAEASELAKAHAGLAEQLGKGAISGSDYAVAMDNLYSSQTHVKESIKDATEAAKEQHKTWLEAQDTLDKITKASLPEHEQGLAAIEEKYVEMDDAIRQMVLTMGMSADKAAELRAGLAANQNLEIYALDKTKAKHKETTSEIDKLWEHTTERMTDLTADWLYTGKSNLESYGEYFEKLVTEMVATWGMGQAKMIFTGGRGSFGGDAYGQSPSAGPGFDAQSWLSTASSLNGLRGGISGVGSALDSLQGSLGFGYTSTAAATGAFGAGSYGAGGFMASTAPSTGWNMVTNSPQAAPAAAGSWSAAMPYLAAATSAFNAYQAFDSGNEIGGTAHTAAAYLALTGNLPAAIVVEIGNFLAERMGLWGGDKENEFTLSEQAPKTDATWTRSGGFTLNPEKHGAGGNSWYAPIQDAYIGGINTLQEQFDKDVISLRGKMSDKAWQAFAKSLESQTFEDDATAAGRWGVSDAAGAITGAVTAYAATLKKGISAALLEAIGTDYLTAEAVTALRAQLASGTDLTPYFDSLSAITNTIDAAVADNGLSQYELGLRGINKQFDTYAYQLESMGIDLSKYTKLEEARAIALEKQAKAMTEVDVVSLAGKAQQAATNLTDFIATRFDNIPDNSDPANLKYLGISGYDQYAAFNPDQSPEQVRRALPGMNSFLESSLASDTSIISAKDAGAMVKGLTAYRDAIAQEKEKLGAWVTESEHYLAIDLPQTIALATQVYDKALKDAGKPFRDVIAAHTGTEFSREWGTVNDTIQKWTDDAAKLNLTGDEATNWMAEIAQAGEMLTQDLIDKTIKPVVGTWKSFFDEINSPSLAPTISYEGEMAKYEKLKAAALEADPNNAQDITQLQQFTSGELLPFLKDYAPGNYQNLFAGIADDLAKIVPATITATVDTTGLAASISEAVAAAIKEALAGVSFNIDGKSVATVLARSASRNPTPAHRGN